MYSRWIQPWSAPPKIFVPPIQEFLEKTCSRASSLRAQRFEITAVGPAHIRGLISQFSGSGAQDSQLPLNSLSLSNTNFLLISYQVTAEVLMLNLKLTVIILKYLIIIYIDIHIFYIYTYTLAYTNFFIKLKLPLFGE